MDIGPCLVVESWFEIEQDAVFPDKVPAAIHMGDARPANVHIIVHEIGEANTDLPLLNEKHLLHLFAFFVDQRAQRLLLVIYFRSEGALDKSRLEANSELF